MQILDMTGSARLIIKEVVSVKSGKAIPGGKPYIAIVILHHMRNGIARLTTRSLNLLSIGIRSAQLEDTSNRKNYLCDLSHCISFCIDLRLRNYKYFF